MLRLGILSDTHLSSPDESFTGDARGAFQSCDRIVHAGELTDASILDVCSDKPVFAVHGNMCSATARRQLPGSRSITADAHLIAFCHGHGDGHDLEDYLPGRFGEADCIIYGQAHSPVIRQIGAVLLLNPGSFPNTGRYGRLGTYAIPTVGLSDLAAEIHTFALSS